MLKTILTGLAVWCALYGTPSDATAEISRLNVSVQPTTGEYSVLEAGTGWKFSGNAGGPLLNLERSSGTDKIGSYREIAFTLPDSSGERGSIRWYSQTYCVLWSETTTKTIAKPTRPFPYLTQVPQGLHHLSFRNDVFSPPTFGLAETGTPWLLFDTHTNTVVISPASDFMAAKMVGDGNKVISADFNNGINTVPAGHTRSVFMLFGHGIQHTFKAWGNAFCRLNGQAIPNKPQDITAKYFGYWTDNGATYYYNYDTALGYAGTLRAVASHYASEGIPLRYMQLDSWWYQKSLNSPSGVAGSSKNSKLPVATWNRYGGTMVYKASPDLFPNGLGAFQKELKLPLVVHGRWIDRTSPYHSEYAFSGIGSVDQRWWNDIAKYLKDNGVITYEEDWLDEIYNNSPGMQNTLDQGDKFMSGMANGTKANGLSMQYCMPLPRELLQGAAYENLATSRVSDDRFDRSKWNPFLYTSSFAYALGVRPWTDVFMSTETANLILANLSSGPVGVGDAIGKESKSNIFEAVMPDGLIVKPDSPIRPTDSSILADSENLHRPMVAFTSSGGLERTGYLFAFTRSGDSSTITVDPGRFGFTRPVWFYNFEDKSSRLVTPGSMFTDSVANAGYNYYILAPESASGIAIVGDSGKFVSMGRQRVTWISDSESTIRLKIKFCAGESSITLHGFAPFAPRSSASDGFRTGVSYDPATRHFTVTVTRPMRSQWHYQARGVTLTLARA